MLNFLSGIIGYCTEGRITLQERLDIYFEDIGLLVTLPCSNKLPCVQCVTHCTVAGQNRVKQGDCGGNEWGAILSANSNT